MNLIGRVGLGWIGWRVVAPILMVFGGYLNVQGPDMVMEDIIHLFSDGYFHLCEN